MSVTKRAAAKFSCRKNDKKGGGEYIVTIRRCPLQRDHSIHIQADLCGSYLIF